MPRHLLLSFQHRAVVRPYTSCCHFAESCVFNKQSSPLILCQQNNKPFILGQSPHFRIYCFVIPSSEVTGSICRVPSTWFSQRLRLLDVFTSVGLQYGDWAKLYFWLFPGKYRRWKKQAFLGQNPLAQSNLQSTPFIFVTKKSYPSNYVFTIFLGAVWLCVDLRSAETFEHSAIMIFTWLYVTHVSILTSDLLKLSLENSFLKYRTFRYPT